MRTDLKNSDWQELWDADRQKRSQWRMPGVGSVETDFLTFSRPYRVAIYIIAHFLIWLVGLVTLAIIRAITKIVAGHKEYVR